MTCRDLDQEKFYLFYTRQGVVKRSAVHFVPAHPCRGTHALGMREDDELIGVCEVERRDGLGHGGWIFHSFSLLRCSVCGSSGHRGEFDLRRGDQIVAGVSGQQEHHAGIGDCG